MAWSTIRTYGLLERWRKRLIQQPYQFQQVNDGYSDYSPAVWIQEERDELAISLMNEVERFNFWVGYNPFPIYHEEIIALDNNKAWYNQILEVSNSSRLIQFGNEAIETLGTGTVTYANNIATVTLAGVLPITSGRIALVFLDADTDDTFNLQYEINDVSISHNGTDYIMQGHQSLFVKPKLQNSLDSFVSGNPNARNELTLNANNFVTQVGVYRIYNDTTTQAELLSIDYSGNSITSTKITPVILNNEFGQFKLTTNIDTMSNLPYAVKVYYQAGKELTNNQIFSPFETAILRQATANLPIDVDTVRYRTSNQWANDRDAISTNEKTFSLSNPIGGRVVDYYTWKVYQAYYDKKNGQVGRYVGK